MRAGYTTAAAYGMRSAAEIDALTRRRRVSWRAASSDNDEWRVKIK